MTLDQAGNLYGTTSTGGASASVCSTGCGVVYKLDPTGNQTVLYTSQAGAGPWIPTSGVVVDAAGNLYGTAEGGLANCIAAACGVLYKLDPAGNETNLYEFQGGLGGNGPTGALVLDAAGNIYGTTCNGGDGAGVVYQVNQGGQETVLYRFHGASNAWCPSGLVRDAAGNL